MPTEDFLSPEFDPTIDRQLRDFWDQFNRGITFDREVRKLNDEAISSSPEVGSPEENDETN